MKTLNPIYIRNFIPKSEDGIYNLVLPTPEMRLVAEKYNVNANLPEIEEVQEVDVIELLTKAAPNKSFASMEAVKDFVQMYEATTDAKSFIKQLGIRSVDSPPTTPDPLWLMWDSLALVWRIQAPALRQPSTTE